MLRITTDRPDPYRSFSPCRQQYTWCKYLGIDGEDSRLATRCARCGGKDGVIWLLKHRKQTQLEHSSDGNKSFVGPSIGPTSKQKKATVDECKFMQVFSNDGKMSGVQSALCRSEGAQPEEGGLFAEQV
eukprot:1329837-Rhodomonas_salina.1